MKKAVLLSLFVLVAMALMAATPVTSTNLSDTVGYASDNTEEGGVGRRCFDPYTGKWVNCYKLLKGKYKIASGEPTMEKISYHKVVYVGGPVWGYTYTKNYGGVWRIGCKTYFFYIGEIKMPVGCNFRYQY